jgi:hypothetical protein
MLAGINSLRGSTLIQGIDAPGSRIGVDIGVSPGCRSAVRQSLPAWHPPLVMLREHAYFTGVRASACHTAFPRRISAMDHRKFDRLTRLFSVPRSRRTALRALIGAALLGTTTREVMATPRCDNDKMCGKDGCCPGKCFLDPCPADKPRGEFCCTGSDYVLCGGTCCKPIDPTAADPCAECRLAGPPPREPSQVCQTGITGSYRRR